MAAPQPPDGLEIQDAWDPVPLREQWPMGLDNYFIMKRLMEVPVEQTLAGATGRVLEVAAAEAVHSCRLAATGLECHVVEPSEQMLARAREHMARHGVRLHLVRGIAEALPYPDRHFDRVLIDSAMDHLAAPDAGLREMLRVLRPNGRFIVSFVNYGSLAVRLSRRVYGVERRLNPAAREAKRFWDSPVPYEHTFECTYRNIGRLCGQYLELDRVLGVSLLWGAPGWARALGRLDRDRALRLLERLDGLARRVPGLADFVLMVWRPRAAGEVSGSGLRALPRLARVTAARPEPPPRRLETLRVTPADPIYRQRAAAERAWEEEWGLAPFLAARMATVRGLENRALSGDPRRSALDLLAARGPFARVALLGGDREDEAETWLRAVPSGTLDVVEASPRRIVRLRRRLQGFGGRVRLQTQDLNFPALSAQHYDLIIAASGTFRVVNLEFFFDEIAQALRPGGLLALISYVGERRQVYAPARLALVNAALAEIPARFRLDEGKGIGPANQDTIAPFGAARSDEILPIVRARFDVVEEHLAGRLFPLHLYLDIPALEREAPALLERLLARERELASHPAATPCTAYVVLRRRA
jgi:ubiquinone/menaquinone biosynthesis C-methylase UbiE